MGTASKYELKCLKSPSASGFDIIGSFGIGASGAVTTTDVKGKGYSVAKEATAGQYTVTIDRPLFDLIAVDGCVESSSPSVLFAVDSFNVAAKTVTLQCTNASFAATNPGSGDRVHFRIHCQRSVAR